MTTSPATLTAPALRRATNAVYAVFVLNGFAFATFASRIPQVRDQLDVSFGALGRLLLCSAIGSLIALPLSGLTVSRLGEARAISLFCFIEAVGLATIGVGYLHGQIPVGVGLFLVGFGSSTWDVAMNVQGASVERHLGRAIMPRFHAGFSLGTVVAAGLGAAFVAVGVSVTVHLVGGAVLIAVATPWCAARFLPHEDAVAPAADADGAPHRSPLRAWTEPRTVLIGLMVLCFAFAEGTGNDWLAVSTISGYHLSNKAFGTVTFAVFLAAMTVGRWFGPGLIDRYGRVSMLRLTAGSALVGLLLVVFGHAYPVALLGAVFWGLGASLGFPVGMSAASDDPVRGPARVSVAASIGYAAFLGGPPLIGFLADHVGSLHALLILVVLLAVAVIICPAAREPSRVPTRTSE